MGPEAMLAGAAIFLLGAIFGRYWPARRKGAKPIQPVCGCKHHYSLHDPKTNECHGSATTARIPVRDEKGRPVKDAYGYVVFTAEAGRCACRRYSGPEPLPEYFAPEVTSG